MRVLVVVLEHHDLDLMPWRCEKQPMVWRLRQSWTVRQTALRHSLPNGSRAILRRRVSACVRS